jgi:hypothetical protein
MIAHESQSISTFARSAVADCHVREFYASVDVLK